MTTSEFPELDDDSVEYLINECDMVKLFGIESTAEYDDFSASQNDFPTYQAPHPCGLPGFAPDYRKDYEEDLEDVFCYSRYNSGDNYIVKLKVDCIKHNTTVALPTILFIKAPIVEIPYKITSKFNPNMIEGIIKVQNNI